MGDILNTKRGINLLNAPVDLSQEEGIKLFDEIEAYIGKGTPGEAPMELSYADAKEKIGQAEQLRLKQAERSPTDKHGVQPLEALNRGMQPPEGLSAWEAEQWKKERDQAGAMKPPSGMSDWEAEQFLLSQQKTTPMGLIDAYTREVAPSIGAGAAGLAVTGGNPLGAAGGILSELGTRFLSPEVAKFMTEKLGIDTASWEQSMSELFDKMGLQKPDTSAERVAQGLGQGTREGLGMWAGGAALQAGAPLLGQGSTAQNIGKILTETPKANIVGETFAGGGAQTGMEIAQENDMGAIGTTLMTLGGGLLGDITGAQMVQLQDDVVKIMKASKKPLPEAAQEAINLFKGKSDLLLTDVPTRSPKLQGVQEKMEGIQGGVESLTKVRQNTRVDRVEGILDEMGVRPQDDYILRDIVDDLRGKRQGELTELTGQRDEIIEKLTAPLETAEGIPGTKASLVATPKTQELIDDLRNTLIDSGDSDLNPLINKLTNWEAMIQDKDFAQMVKHKNTMGKFYSDPDFANVTDDSKKAINKVRDSLSNEIDSFVESSASPEDFNKWMTSKERLSDMMGDFKIESLKQVLDRGEYNVHTIDTLLNDTNRETADTLFENLTPEGRLRARAAIFGKMADESTQYGKLSPNAFTEKLTERMPQFRSFIDADEILHLEGINTWLDMTAGDEIRKQVQARMPGEKLPGGRYALARAVFMNPAIGVPLGAVATVAPGKLTKWMATGEMRDLMIKLGEIPVNSSTTLIRQRMGKRAGEILRGYMAAEERSTQEASE